MKLYLQYTKFKILSQRNQISDYVCYLPESFKLPLGVITHRLRTTYLEVYLLINTIFINARKVLFTTFRILKKYIKLLH